MSSKMLSILTYLIIARMLIFLVFMSLESKRPGDAVISEIDANGKLDEKNSNYRMSKGFLWGAAGSAGTP